MKSAFNYHELKYPRQYYSTYKIFLCILFPDYNNQIHTLLIKNQDRWEQADSIGTSQGKSLQYDLIDYGVNVYVLWEQIDSQNDLQCTDPCTMT